MFPLVAVAMGSDTDMKIMAQTTPSFNIPYEIRILSAHRTAPDVAEYAEQAEARGLKIIIAGAGGAAHNESAFLYFD